MCLSGIHSLHIMWHFKEQATNEGLHDVSATFSFDHHGHYITFIKISWMLLGYV